MHCWVSLLFKFFPPLIQEASWMSEQTKAGPESSSTRMTDKTNRQCWVDEIVGERGRKSKCSIAAVNSVLLKCVNRIHRCSIGSVCGASAYMYVSDCIDTWVTDPAYRRLVNRLDSGWLGRRPSDSCSWLSARSHSAVRFVRSAARLSRVRVCNTMVTQPGYRRLLCIKGFM